MPDLYDYYEKVESQSPSASGFSIDGGGRATITFDVAPTNILNKIREILGYTAVNPAGPGLIRVPPKAHPVFPWLFAERVSEIKGLGQPTLGTSDIFTEVEPFDNFASYPRYRMTIEFTPRPYVLCLDDKIAESTLNWSTPSATAGVNDQLNVAYAKEWMRYVDVEFQGASQYLTAQRGSFLFRVGGAGADATINGAEAGTGQVRMRYPKSTVIYHWYQVPYYYVEHPNSYLLAGLGNVNQFLWDGWPAGTMLYKDYKTRRYTMPAPDIDFVLDGDGNVTTIFANNKYCDIDLIFEYIEPPLTTAPAAIDIVNNNVIAYGHNLMPYSNTASWYMATCAIAGTVSPANDKKPVYPSYPFELLFSKPV